MGRWGGVGTPQSHLPPKHPPSRDSKSPHRPRRSASGGNLHTVHAQARVRPQIPGEVKVQAEMVSPLLPPTLRLLRDHLSSAAAWGLQPPTPLLWPPPGGQIGLS